MLCRKLQDTLEFAVQKKINKTPNKIWANVNKFLSHVQECWGICHIGSLWILILMEGLWFVIRGGTAWFNISHMGKDEGLISPWKCNPSVTHLQTILHLSPSVESSRTWPKAIQILILSLSLLLGYLQDKDQSETFSDSEVWWKAFH